MTLDPMTKATLKTLWFAGGGVLMTWMAVAPNNSAPSPSVRGSTQPPASARELTAEDLNAEAAKLRGHLGGPLRRSTRNPFRFVPKTASAGTQRAEPASNVPAAPLTPPQPSWTLSGIAERTTPEGPKRTAVISGDGQVYLVAEGEMLAGRYTAIKIDADAVLLRDASGSELTLALR